ncbi:hypothetical protein IJG72_07975 [bacterium]|nr:hypothetical protein [bacterium]
MKKLIATAILFVEVAGLAVNAAVFAPEWTEFCPPKYCESNENKFSKDVTYWYKRRLQFNNALAKCSAYQGKQLDACYDELRAAENRKNEVWDVRYEEKTRATEYQRQYNKERMEFYGVNRIIETIKK